MVFSSVSFLLFFLTPLLVFYFIVPARFRGLRNGILLLFSLAFYGFGGLSYLMILLVSVLVNYTCGRMVDAAKSKRWKQIAVALSVLFGLGAMGWFKYSGFFVETVNALGMSLPVPEVTLPIGISFFTFQGLSYVIDVYRGDAKCQKNPLYVALYIALFPQLVAGPIVRYQTVASEIEDRRETVSEFSDGLTRFLLGLSKKLLLANAMGEVADSVYAIQTASLSTATAWIGAVAYTMQIYFDFSAYSDMAIGLGRMFGFHFLENFNYPYIAMSVTDFWRRWHISLTTWFRDYLYIPLGGNRCRRWKHIRNLAVVWFLTGLWHGASWNFIVWGAWFFVLLMGEKFVWGGLLEQTPGPLRHLYTMLLVMISWVFFRAPDLSSAVDFLAVMFGQAGAGLVSGDSVYYLRQYLPEFVLCVVGACPIKIVLQRYLNPRKERIGYAVVLAAAPKALAMGLLGLSYMKLASGGFNPFIYFQF